MSGATQILVQADAFRVSSTSAPLVCELRAALAVCVHDDTQGVGGLLHLQYVATSNDQPIDLTDNTLSSDLLLMDRFCKELRALGARKHSWRVNILAHTPARPGLQAPAATVIDLVKAYFNDSRRPVEAKEFPQSPGVLVRFDAREGCILSTLLTGTSESRSAAPV